LPKGELFHIQNTIGVGWVTSIPITTRVNDFWVEYENNRIHQFYSNLSILDAYGES
jgi:cytochrome c biogenesis protein ResB